MLIESIGAAGLAPAFTTYGTHAAHGARAAHAFALAFVPYDQLMPLVVSTLIFAGIGIVLFALAFWIIVKAAPFSIRKEIEDDQNTALAIVIAAVIIGIALIVASAIH